VSDKILFWVTGKDDAGRHMVRIYEPYEADPGMLQRTTFSAQAYAVEPGLIRFSPGDRHHPRSPYPAGATIPALRIGQVVSVSVCRGWPDSEETALRIGGDIQIIGEGLDKEAALKPCDALLGRSRSWSFPFTHSEIIEWEAAAERVRSEPNQALIVTWRGSEGRDGESHVIRHKGAYLFHASDNGSALEDLGLAETPGPGLWIMADGHYWSVTNPESDYPDDYGMHGDYAPATVAEAAAAFGLPEEEVLEAISDIYPFEFEGALLDAIHLPDGVTATPPVTVASN
jgi:hypothetical protein